MGIMLTKGGRIDLSKEAPTMTKIQVGLGWKENVTDTGAAFDLDVTAFGLTLESGEPKLAGRRDHPDYMVFYGTPNLKSIDGAIVHSGDNRTGNTDGHDEVVTVDLTLLDPKIDEISFIVTIHDAVARKQNFGQVSNSYIAITDETTGNELARFNLEEDFSVETAVQFGSLYKRPDGHWAFKAIGSGYQLGLDAFVTGYGGIVG